MKEIFNRRSIRKYDEKPVEKELIEKLLRAGMQAPSAASQRPWEFIVIRNRATLDALSLTCPYSIALKNAGCCIVLVGNRKRMTYPEFWQQDMGACAENILLEAVYLDLGAVWLGVAPLEERMDHVKKVLDLEAGLEPFCIISLGNLMENRKNKFVDWFDIGRIRYDEE